MDANGFHKSVSTPFVLVKETAEAIPMAFHPDRITFCPAAQLKCLYELDKIMTCRGRVIYYGIIVHNDRLYVITSFEIFEIFIRHEIHTTRNSYERPNSYELHVVRFSCSKVI